MPTDIRKLNLEDLLGRLYCAYINPERDEGDASEIEAEIARRIEVRDRVVKWLMDFGSFVSEETSDGLMVRRDGDYNPTYYDQNGEQIL